MNATPTPTPDAPLPDLTGDDVLDALAVDATLETGPLGRYTLTQLSRVIADLNNTDRVPACHETLAQPGRTHGPAQLGYDPVLFDAHNTIKVVALCPDCRDDRRHQARNRPRH